ncbi:MAG: LacI family transcriptional regulator [Chloroflexi bacterium]|nr:LacI family transcriptional regulator [Chloroflexota bacterium]
MTRRVTISDVAKLAGVSSQTVSRVINNKPEVSPKTRQRVLEVIEQTGYRPSAVARGLATSRTSTIGMVVPDISNPFFSDIARGIEATAYDQGYNVFLCNSNEDPERELEVLFSLEEKQVDGVILCGLRQKTPALQDVLKRFPAIVLVNRLMDDASYPTVMVDNHKGAQKAVGHILNMGRKRVGILVGPAFSYSANQRKSGYLDAMEGAGISVEDGWIQYCTPTVEGGEEATKLLLKRHPQLDALFCFNDLVAVGAIQACGALNRRIPNDIAIVGFDDVYLAALVTPALTTCRVPRVEMGRQAMNLLLRQMKGQRIETPVITVKTRLIIRNSAPKVT